MVLQSTMQLFIQWVLILAAVASSGITVYYAAVRIKGVEYWQQLLAVVLLYTMQLFVQGVLSTSSSC